MIFAKMVLLAYLQNATRIIALANEVENIDKAKS